MVRDQMEGKMEGGSDMAVNFGKSDAAGKDILKRLARSDPYYVSPNPELSKASAA